MHVVSTIFDSDLPVLTIVKIKIQVFFKRALNSHKHSTQKSAQLSKALSSQDPYINLQKHPTHKCLQHIKSKDIQWTPKTFETIMEALHIHAWPKHCGMDCTPQSLHIHNKDNGIDSVIYILSSKKITVMKDVNNSGVKFS